MSGRFGPENPSYTIIPPRGDSELALIEAAVTVVSRLFEAGAAAAREEANRAIIQRETNARIEEFRVNMGLLERQLNDDNKSEQAWQQNWFQIANKLVDKGNDQAAVAVLEIISKLGRKSLVLPLIEYHERVTAALFKPVLPPKRDA
jgi:hypothetical protein